MRSKKIVFILGILGVFVILGTGLFFGLGQNKLASLEVRSNVVTPVFIDGKNMGNTPYLGIIKPADITLKLGSYETKLQLIAGTKTIVSRDFSKDLRQSSGLILSFEDLYSGSSSLAIVSDPIGAQVIVDQVLKGFTPLRIDNLSIGSHKLNIVASGYQSQGFDINVVSGKKLVTIVDLQKEEKQQVINNAPPSVSEKKVEILSTPTGFLRVRIAPNPTSSEIAEVHPGETYKFLGDDATKNWFNIEIDASTSGWISNTYAAIKN